MTQHVLETLTPQGYVSKGVEYLSVGDEKNARLYLNKAIAVAPNGRVARTAAFLLEQMYVDPKQYLGQKSFPYRVKHGESLALIAKRFLGNSLKFYILARYNDIANPSYLEVGQVIHIPGKRRPEPDRQARPPQPSASERLSQDKVEPDESVVLSEPLILPEPVELSAVETVKIHPRTPSAKDLSANELYGKTEQLYKTGDYQGAITLLEDREDLDQRALDLLVESYRSRAGELRARGRFQQARIYMERAFGLKPTDTIIQKNLDELSRILDGREAERLYRQGVAERQAGEWEKAYGTFNQVLSLNPKHSSAQQQIAEIKTILVENYHRQALSLYKSQQDLCKAIALWDRALKLEPAYTPALMNRETAQKVVKKLGKSCR